MFFGVPLIKKSVYRVAKGTTRAVCACVGLGVGPIFPCGELKELAYSKQCFLVFL